MNGETISEKVFNILKGFGYNVRSFSKLGDTVIDPADATRFVINDPNIIVRIDEREKEIYLFSSEKFFHHKVRIMLENLCKNFLLKFKYQVLNKKIQGAGEKMDIERNKKIEANESVMEGFSNLHGTIKTSYQTLNNDIKIVIRHKRPVDESIKGARSRNIQSVYIQQGRNRFKLSENSLLMARAMARHIDKGGDPDDPVAHSINRMGADLRKLKEFLVYVKKSKLINEGNKDYIQLASEGVINIRNMFKKISGVTTYDDMVANILEEDNLSNIEDNLNLENLFTETHFDNKVSQVLGTLQSLSVKKKTFENYLQTVIKYETFSELKKLLSENDAIEFTSPAAKLGFHISQLGLAAQDARLSNYLQSLSKSVNEGNNLTTNEYAIVKSCLLAADKHKTNEAKSKDDEHDTHALRDFFYDPDDRGNKKKKGKKKATKKTNENYEMKGSNHRSPHYWRNFEDEDWDEEYDKLYKSYYYDDKMSRRAARQKAHGKIQALQREQEKYFDNATPEDLESMRYPGNDLRAMSHGDEGYGPIPTRFRQREMYR